MSSSYRERGELLVPVEDRDGKEVPLRDSSLMLLAATTLLGTEPMLTLGHVQNLTSSTSTLQGLAIACRASLH